jgi:Kef-type K+ transport system membrane component KefB
MRGLLLLAALVVFMLALDGFRIGDLDAQSAGARTSLVFGFLLLAGYLLGQLARRIGLPRITGFIVAGILFGPYLMGIVTPATVQALGKVDEIALCLIALAAGGEMDLARLRGRLRSVLSIVGVQTVVVLGGVLAVFLVLPIGEWIGVEDRGLLIAVALVIGAIAVANSPSTIIAVILDLDAEDPLSDTAIAVTVLKDVMVIVLFAAVLSLTGPLLDPGAAYDLAFVGAVAMEVLISIGLGLLAGGAVVLFLRHVSREEVLFVLILVFGLATLCRAWHLDALITCITAGLVVQNLSGRGPTFMRAIDRSAMPVFVLFFALAGARLDLSTLGHFWLPAVALFAGRGVLTWAGTSLGSRLAGDPPVLVRHGWMAFLAQAGVSLGFVALLREDVPVLGDLLGDVVIAAIILNQLVGPVLFKIALDRAGEVGQAETEIPETGVVHERAAEE